MRSWLLVSFALVAVADYRQYRDGNCGSSATLDFENAEVVYNNLGGQGPNDKEPQEMLYRNLGTYRDPQGNEKEIGLRLKNLTEYQAVNTDQNNGKTDGMGSVNVRLTTEVYLDFQFLAATTGDPSSWEKLCFGQGGMTFYDVDSGGDKDSGRRRRSADNIGETEIISMCPAADSVSLSDDYYPPVTPGLEKNAFVAAQPQPEPAPEACEMYRQQHADLYNVLNPGQGGTSPDNLQTDQIAHTITYWWNNLCHFRVYFKSDGTNSPNNGRNFWFTGTANQSITCTTTSTTTTSTSTTSVTTSTTSTTTTTLHRACFDDHCDICRGENRTCLYAILCTMGEILRPGDSTNPRPPPDGRKTCEIASAIVGKKCPACKECNACPFDHEVPTKFLKLFEASEDALTRAEDEPSHDVELSVVTSATVLASAAAVAALTAAFAGLRWRALSRRQAGDVVEDEELVTESSE